MVTVEVADPEAGMVRADGDKAVIWFPVTLKMSPEVAVPPSGLTTVTL
jgi:hypothetical protein